VADTKKEGQIVTGEQQAITRGRLKLLLIALIFLGPLGVAAWLYYEGTNLQPEGRTNAGRLLEPIVNVNAALDDTSLAQLTGGASEGGWIMLYRNEGECGEACEEALYRMRQSRLMLGRDMTRVTRVFLHGDIAPDKVRVDAEHEGLVTIRHGGLAGILDRKRPTDLPPGGLYLIDPLGNLVMYFTADLAPDDMVADIEHLLDLSRIG
jgi:hypothetical protein